MHFTWTHPMLNFPKKNPEKKNVRLVTWIAQSGERPRPITKVKQH